MISAYNMQEALKRHNPIWKYPPKHWEQGLPLGNGAMGAVIWGNGLPLNLTIDNTNFWDRTGWKPSNLEKFKWSNFKQLIEEGKVKEGESEFQNPGTAPISTRIPPGRLELGFPEGTRFSNMELDLYDAVAYGKLINKDKDVRFSSFIHSKEDLLVMEFEGDVQPTFKFRIFSDPEDTPINLKSVNRGSYTFGDWIKRYPSPEHIKDKDIEIFSQEVPDGGKLAYAFTVKSKDDKITLYLSTAYDREGKTAARIASGIVKRNFTTSLNEIARDHSNQWHTYYNASFISIPDTRLEGLYWMEIYKLRCCTRPDTPPISLHGPWSPEGKMPPWGGDYHHNINVQMSYWPIYASNHLELGFSLYNFIKRTRPAFKKFCKEFFERDDLPLQTSHRHHSHLMPIHPLHLLTLDGTEEEKSLIRNSIRQLIFMGHGEWVGFSFSWAASIFACTGYPDLARTMLLDYTDKMITENTFMMQGPQRGCDMSVHGTYALTLEAGFGAANALLDMLIQSYGGIIRLFPGVPEGWQEAVFHNLRAEGAYLVSAIRKDGKCVLARIFSEKGGKVKIQGNFGTDKVLIFSSRGKYLSESNIRNTEVKLRKEEEIFIVPEGYDFPAKVEIRKIKGKEYEHHFFGVKNKVSLFPRL